MTKLLLYITALIFITAVLPIAAYDLGNKTATFRIAQQCALDNYFIEHGNEFYCQDIEDYAGK